MNRHRLAQAVGPCLQRCFRGWGSRLFVYCLIGFSPSIARALEHVSFTQDGVRQHVSGRILVEAQDGGLLLEGQDGAIWVVQPTELLERSADDIPFRTLDKAELSEQLLAEMPPDFRSYETAHYLIIYNTSRAYAEWSGALYERLHRAFYNFWRGLKVPLEDSPPLVAIVLRDRSSYVERSRGELGDAAQSILGYYSLKSNRITTYDLTGTEGLQPSGRRVNSLKLINRILAQPAAERTVATVIHEATHQLAFNSGLQRRFADNPLWLSEGLAIYFESPDLNSQRGWRQIGALNQVRLRRLQQYLPLRPADSLRTLLVDDQRFRNPQLVDDAYAEAWALCYYLIRSRPQQFANYLQQIRQKPPLGEDGPDLRIEQFEQSFQTDLSTLDAEFLRACAQWR